MSKPNTPHPAVVAFSALLAAVLAGRNVVVIAEHGVPIMITVSAGLAMFASLFWALYHLTRRTN